MNFVLNQEDKKSINRKNEESFGHSFHAVINPPRDGIGLVGTENNFENTQNINGVFLIWAGISVLEQKVSQGNF